MFNRLLTIVFLSVTTLASASQIEVWGRIYDYSCGYFSRRATDLSITLHDTSLPYGTEVNAIVGFKGSYSMGGSQKQVDWQDRVVIKTEAINQNTWEARILDKTLHNRTEGRFLESLQFVFEARMPGQPSRYFNGGTVWGYYETDPLAASVPCVTGTDFPPWYKISFRTIEKEYLD